MKSLKQTDYRLAIKSALFGVAVGDALGVPVEFMSREALRQNPVTDMRGYGSYYQPAGTWSDDSSLTFCLADALTHDFNISRVASNCMKWVIENFWTARGEVFDIGSGTSEAIRRLTDGVEPEQAGGTAETNNGNGSLMRILPLVFYLLDKPIEERFRITKQVSSITHGHIRSVIACFYYLELARIILLQKDKVKAYNDWQKTVADFDLSKLVPETEITKFDRLLKGDISTLTEKEIKSSGYVLYTLEAAVWCFLTTNSYEECVLKAVNLGGDTDTTAAVAGGLAGLCYGYNNIPERWLSQLARREDIEDLAARLAAKGISTIDI
ncbi:MAG: ADP-ribosylglycohydrolase family protein [Prevotellaceae bacterium]|jgi:ADP-ribosylglycohydrolase|nr:ADP-ribosylglycohydrolase family protein [Prevotellaceae bacterium]